MGVMYYILSPFSWLLNFFYSFTDSYGISLILFALVIKIILFPLTIKGKKGMIQMNLLSGKMQQMQKQRMQPRKMQQLMMHRKKFRQRMLRQLRNNRKNKKGTASYGAVLFQYV